MAIADQNNLNEHEMKRKRSKHFDPPQIFKVQRSAFTTAPSGDRVLIYNQDRSVFSELDTPNEVKRLLKPGTKGYFYCEIKDGNLEIGLKAAEQEW